MYIYISSMQFCATWVNSETKTLSIEGFMKGQSFVVASMC